MKRESLLLKACLCGAFGTRYPYPGGAVYEAGFIYLTGTPDEEWLSGLKAKWDFRMFVCLSNEWEKALTARYPDLHAVTRHQMSPDHARMTTQKLLPLYGGAAGRVYARALR